MSCRCAALSVKHGKPIPPRGHFDDCLLLGTPKEAAEAFARQYLSSSAPGVDHIVLVAHLAPLLRRRDAAQKAKNLFNVTTPGRATLRVNDHAVAGCTVVQGDVVDLVFEHVVDA